MNNIQILKQYKNDVGFIRFQIESYNNFIDNGLQKIVDEIKEINQKFQKLAN